MAVKNGYLIVNNASDLVTVDISDLNKVKEVARVKNAFKYYDSYNWINAKPTEKGKYYVCPYSLNGQDIIGWKLEKDVANANCFSN